MSADRFPGWVRYSGVGLELAGAIAGLAFIAISSTNGKFGGVRASNGSFYATNGLTGVYAPSAGEMRSALR